MIVDESWAVSQVGRGRVDRRKLVGAGLVLFPFWVGGTIDAAGPIGDVLALAGIKTKEWAPLLKTKTFVIGLTPQEDLIVVGNLFTGEAKSAQALEAWLKDRPWPGAKSFRVEGPPPDVTDAAAQWITFQVRSDVETVQRRLKF